MSEFKGQTLSWQIVNGAIELALHRDPCNEIGSLTLVELEKFAAALSGLANEAHALIVHSTLKAGFQREQISRVVSARARSGKRCGPARGAGVSGTHSLRHERARRGAADDDRGGPWGDLWRGFELALVCDIIVADRMGAILFPGTAARLIPGFGGFRAEEGFG